MSRVVIGKNFLSIPVWKRYLGIPFIYLPLFVTVPFMLLAVLSVRTHLRFCGAQNLRGYWSFVPAWASHRYKYEDQITFTTDTSPYQFRGYRWYWIFNCKLYCPMSVALFAYGTYLVKVVENWWCPFDHEKKEEYAVGAIDKSYWHIFPDEYDKLHAEDQNNPVWNEEAELKGAVTSEDDDLFSQRLGVTL